MQRGALGGAKLKLADIVDIDAALGRIEGKSMDKDRQHMVKVVNQRLKRFHRLSLAIKVALIATALAQSGE